MTGAAESALNAGTLMPVMINAAARMEFSFIRFVSFIMGDMLLIGEKE